MILLAVFKRFNVLKWENKKNTEIFLNSNLKKLIQYTLHRSLYKQYYYNF